MAEQVAVQTKVLEILTELTGESVAEKMDENLFDSGLIDSMATVELVVELQESFGIDIPISEFNRDDWDTPNKIVAKVGTLL